MLKPPKRYCHRCSKRLMSTETTWCNSCVRAGLNERTGHGGRERPLGFRGSAYQKMLTEGKL